MLFFDWMTETHGFCIFNLQSNSFWLFDVHMGVTRLLHSTFKITQKLGVEQA